MKTQLFTLLIIGLCAFFACQPAGDSTDNTATTVESNAPDYAAFNQKVAAIRSFLQAHCDEDITTQSNMVADTFQWSPPQYNGNQWLGKEEYVAALQSYHDNYENITFTEGIVTPDSTANGVWAGSIFPEGTATSEPNAIRVYGTWSATHSATGKEIGVKWFGISWLNDDNQLAQMTEYWDVHGLAAQIAEQ